FALQRSLVGYVPRGDFERMTQQKEFVTELNRLAGERLVKVTNRLEEMVFRDVPSRLASLLLRLADEFPAQRNGRRVIDVRLTQQDLADLIGATRETTSIAINDFRRRGLLDAGRGSITILSPDGLAALAD
ncbi:MAG TPA: Crp/Fnr family transcriptional regulator, partial [Candidatus Krumholzibacteria bacterium]|nr:Crp/Fnr family transcriptional regulator [Candidatus Krumholzibacteria bacterium]